ncbi:MAG: ArnT family glycosyltransferase [Roseimicrobium sp.]
MTVKPLQAYLTLVAFWACIYLPGLGSREIRGEEWRRTLPARTMLQTGEWLVPYSAGEPYLRKPPLINWVTAASFHVTGVQNEWTARLPSVLLVLLAVLGMHAFARLALGASAASVGSVCVLTTLGVIEKGRIAELEVYYIAFTGLAFTAWLAGHMGRLQRWISWLAAGLFLGLGLLTKGPMHLFFFYALVVGACWKGRRLRDLVSWSHLAGLAVCLAVFLAWAVPFVEAYGRIVGVAGGDVLKAWSHEVSSRVTGEERTSFFDWLLRGPRACTMFLPWVVLVPLWWRRSLLAAVFTDEAHRKLFEGLASGVAVSFALMVLLPSSSPRYVAPLLAPASLLTGWLLAAGGDSLRTVMSRWQIVNRVGIAFSLLVALVGLALVLLRPDLRPPLWTLALVTAGLCLAAGIVYYRPWAVPLSCTLVGQSVIVVALLVAALVCFVDLPPERSTVVRPLSLAIRQFITPQDGPLYAFHLGPTPYPFYLPNDTVEVDKPQQMPEAGVRWILTNAKTEQAFRVWFERRYGTVAKVAEFNGTWGASSSDPDRRLVLLRFGESAGVAR